MRTDFTFHSHPRPLPMNFGSLSLSPAPLTRPVSITRESPRTLSARCVLRTPPAAVGAVLSFCRGIPGVPLLADKFRRTSAYAFYDGIDGRVRRCAIPSWGLSVITPTSPGNKPYFHHRRSFNRVKIPLLCYDNVNIRPIAVSPAGRAALLANHKAGKNRGGSERNGNLEVTFTSAVQPSPFGHLHKARFS
jgi:hypothetical protein